MREKKVASSKSALFMLGLFVLVFVVLFYIFLKMSSLGGKMHVGPSGGPALYQVLSEHGGYRLFSDERRELEKKKFAGFWEFVTDTLDSGALQERDRIELKDNGIVWEVREFVIRLPLGDSAGFTQVIHAYMNPYGLIKKDTGVTVCEARILRQVMISKGDTCYGPSQVDCTWRARRSGNVLELEHRRYSPYGNAPLSSFFPAGAIDLINKVSIAECPEGWTPISFAEKAVAAEYKTITAGRRSIPEVNDIIARYYAPLVKENIRQLSSIIFQAIPPSLTATFKLLGDGSTAEIEIQGEKTRQTPYSQAIAGHVAAWVFPKLKQEDRAFDMTYSFTF